MLLELPFSNDYEELLAYWLGGRGEPVGWAGAQLPGHSRQPEGDRPGRQGGPGGAPQQHCPEHTARQQAAGRRGKPRDQGARGSRNQRWEEQAKTQFLYRSDSTSFE